MLRLILLFFIFNTVCAHGQTSAARHISLPPGQLLLHDRSVKTEERSDSSNYMVERFHFPAYLPITIAPKNIYGLKYVEQVEVCDKSGQLAYVFEFNFKGLLQSGKITGDHLIRWRRYRSAENAITSVVAYYNKQGRLARRDSVITTFFEREPADTAVSYTSTSHWVYLSGEVVNERNTYYNDKYYNKRLSVQAKDLSAQQRQRATKARIYLKKMLPTDYKTDLIYPDHFFQEDKNFVAIVYSDTGKTEIYSQLPASHYIKKRYHPLTTNTYSAQGADFMEPGLTAKEEIDFTALGLLNPGDRNKRSPDHYKCTVTRRGLIDSVFKEDQNNPTGTSLSSLIYTVRYRYGYSAYFSGNEYEMEPQIILREQDSRYGKTYYQANFNKYYEVRSGNSLWLADVKAFVKNRVKIIHVYYTDKELQAFVLDTAGNIIGGMEGSGNRRWRNYTDKNGNRIFVNEYYDGYGWLQKKDSTIDIPKIVRNKDTTFSYLRTESFHYKKGILINERNRQYNEEYLNKRVRYGESIGSYGAVNPDDPRGKTEGYIYLAERLKTNYLDDQLYLCNKSTGDHGFKVTKDTSDITTRIPTNHPVRKKLIIPEVTKKPVSGEDFHPPYGGFSGPICGGSGYSGHYESSNESEIFKSYSWTLNSKGLYDTCYKTEPVRSYYYSREDFTKRAIEQPEKKAPVKWAVYTVRYEYY